jgi:hypothetical protein
MSVLLVVPIGLAFADLVSEILSPEISGDQFCIRLLEDSSQHPFAAVVGVRYVAEIEA